MESSEALQFVYGNEGLIRCTFILLRTHLWPSARIEMVTVFTHRAASTYGALFRHMP